MKISFLSGLILILILNISLFPQKRPLDMAILGEPLKDFTIQVFEGGEFRLSDYNGKNILLVFPRGYYDKDVWCDICAYEYLDIVDEFYTKKMAEKYNVEVAIVLPYDAGTIAEWLSDMPELYAGLESGKHVADTMTNERTLTWMRFANKHYPKSFKLSETPKPFKILMDDRHELSDRLDLFKTEWWGTKVEQNMPAIILLDKKGTVIFKYVSQHTIDRPGTEYLIKIMDSFL